MLVVVRRQSVVLSPTSGPVAQLGARFHGMEEVAGSIPARSTNPPNELYSGERFWRRLACPPIAHDR